MTGAVDWTSVAAIATVAGVVLGVLARIAQLLWRVLIAEVRKTQSTAETVERKVTTPAQGTIGQVTARIEKNQKLHDAKDDARITAIWKELGKPEPAPVKAARTIKKATKRRTP